MDKYPFKTTPFAHQLEALKQGYSKPEYALLMEMGTGKSKVLIDNIAMLYDEGKIDGVLIIAPKGVYRNWFNRDSDGTVYGEIPTHLPDHVKYYAAYWSSYMTQERTKSLQYLWRVQDCLHVLIMNVEALSTTGGVEFALKFLKNYTCLMAVDESTMIKNPKAKRTKAAIKLGGYAKYRRILSGMPITKSPLDLYSQGLFLDWHLLGFSSWFTFRNRYAIVKKMQFGNRSFDKVVGFQRLDELTDKIKSFSFRVTKDECLDLPDKLYQYRDVELTPEQLKYYAQMKSLSLIELGAAEYITAPMVMTKIQKLHEIVCGFVRNPQTGEITEIPSNRIDAVLEILEDTDRKVIIWSNNTYDMYNISKHIINVYGPESVATYFGDTKDDARERIRRDFQSPDSPLRFFISNPATGRFGMTLTEAKIVIYYSNDYNLENRVQSEDRAHRIGQTDNVTIIDLVARGTIDEKIIKILREKKNLSEVVMGDDPKKWLE